MSVAETLISLDSKLDPGKFMRVHRSAIVKYGRIVAVHTMTGGAYEPELRGGGRIKAGRQYRDNIRKLLWGATL
jgi:two-component system LytT family response regulator